MHTGGWQQRCGGTGSSIPAANACDLFGRSVQVTACEFHACSSAGWAADLSCLPRHAHAPHLAAYVSLLSRSLVHSAQQLYTVAVDDAVAQAAAAATTVAANGADSSQDGGTFGFLADGFEAFLKVRAHACVSSSRRATPAGLRGTGQFALPVGVRVNRWELLFPKRSSHNSSRVGNLSPGLQQSPCAQQLPHCHTACRCWRVALHVQVCPTAMALPSSCSLCWSRQQPTPSPRSR